MVIKRICQRLKGHTEEVIIRRASGTLKDPEDSDWTVMERWNEQSCNYQ